MAPDGGAGGEIGVPSSAMIARSPFRSLFSSPRFGVIPDLDGHGKLRRNLPTPKPEVDRRWPRCQFLGRADRNLSLAAGLLA